MNTTVTTDSLERTLKTTQAWLETNRVQGPIDRVASAYALVAAIIIELEGR